MSNTLFVVGLGPGDAAFRTPQAADALDVATDFFGYNVYLDLIREEYPDKRYHNSHMLQEIARCKAALECAASGNPTCLVCSGDAGVYGMASPILELAPSYPGVEVIVVPGVTAALSCAAILGAPLGHDFAVISLSDRLTPWRIIIRKLEAAAAADFVLCLYNPASNHRPDHLRMACDILLEHLPADRPCGIVRLAGRAGSAHSILTLQELRDYPADMFCTAFIGSTTTHTSGGRLITPRGYRAP